MKAIAIILVWSSVRYFRILCQALSLLFAEMQRFIIWFLKGKLQSILMPKSLTIWVLQRVFPSIEIVKFSIIFALGLNNIIWNFFGFATKLLFLNHFKTSIILDFKISFRNVRFLSSLYLYKVLSSAKLHISVVLKSRRKSFRNMLNSKGPKIDPWGIPLSMVT